MFLHQQLLLQVVLQVDLVIQRHQQFQVLQVLQVLQVQIVEALGVVINGI